jgi:hypothetical protein
VVTWSAPAGERELPPGAGLLAGTGKGAEFLSRNVEQGDTISVFLGYNLQLPGVHHVLGGAGRILAGGRDVSDSMAVVEGIKPSFLSARHPRTFVAINRDTTRVFLCTVDGRQTSSIGMTFGEMADFLQDIGAWDGINLDGGGSTTMVIRGAVVNSPSDPSGERPVANSLHVIAPGFPLR